MSEWVLVPCLVGLRSEFNAVSPGRDKGADGSIGDAAHSPSSDHTPDEDSPILRDHDADSKNEVHALDIDSSGPWPGGPAWFDQQIKALWKREMARGPKCRLQYVIWNKKIANRDIQGGAWRTYTGSSDDHTNHAHFSSRYTTAQEADTSPWGLEGDDMDLADLIKLTDGAKTELGGSYAKTGTVTLETAYNLLLIYTARAADRSAEADNAATAADDRVAILTEKVDALTTLVSTINTPAAGPIDYDKLAAALLRGIAAAG